jgi:hypothetical protein
MGFQPAFANDVSIGINRQQPYDKTFSKTFGERNDDWRSCVQQTTDGGYIVIGSTNVLTAGSWDAWLLKTDSNGNMMWKRTFGGADYELGRYVQQTTDGGFILICETTPGGVWLIKTDSNGTKMWDKTFGNGVCYTVQQTTDSGYIITGTKDGDVWLFKTDINGDMEWNRTFGGSSSDIGYFGQQTTDGGYIVIGSTYSFGVGESDVWLIKTDSNGNMMWNRTFGRHAWDEGYSGQQTSDGGYIITGMTGEKGSPWPYVLLLKTDSNGTKMWEKLLDWIDYDVGWCVQQTTDGGYIITGYTETWGLLFREILLIKTDSFGNRIWTETIGHDGIGYCVRQTTDGGYIITGIYDSYHPKGIQLIKTSSAGTMQWVKIYHIIKGKTVGDSAQQSIDTLTSEDCDCQTVFSDVDLNRLDKELDRLESYRGLLSLLSKCNTEIKEKNEELLNKISAIKNIKVSLKNPVNCLFVLLHGFIITLQVEIISNIAKDLPEDGILYKIFEKRIIYLAEYIADVWIFQYDKYCF